MASKTNFSVQGTELACNINQPNTHQMQEPADDTLNGLKAPTGSGSTTTSAVVVFALPCDQSFSSPGKKASDQRVEGSTSTSKRKRKEICDQRVEGSTRTSKRKRKEICNTVPVEHEIVTFDKNERIWEAAESLEAFKLTPHKPHFRPLKSYREIQLEGKALSLMVLYDKITKKTLNLQREAARAEIENDLSLLKKLEIHGFDVLKMRNAWNRLLFLKDQEEDIDKLQKKNKRRLTKFDSDLCKLKEKRIKMQDELKKLMEEARLAYLEVKNSEDDIASDQLAIKNYDDELARIRMEARELVATPLY